MFSGYSLRSGDDRHLPVSMANLTDLVEVFPSPWVALLAMDHRFPKVASGEMEANRVIESPSQQGLVEQVRNPDVFAALERLELIQPMYDAQRPYSISAYVYLKPFTSVREFYSSEMNSSFLDQARQNRLEDSQLFLFLHSLWGSDKPPRQAFEYAAGIAYALIPAGAMRDAAVAIGPGDGPSILYRMDEFLAQRDSIVAKNC